MSIRTLSFSIVILVGMISSFAALILEHDLHYGSGAILGCGAAVVSGCQRVALSSISTGISRISLGAIGVSYFLTYGLLFFFSNGLGFRRLISALALFMGITLIFYSAFAVKAFCTYCILVDICLLALVIEAKTNRGQAQGNALTRFKKEVIFFVVLLPLLAFVTERGTFAALAQKRSWNSEIKSLHWSELQDFVAKIDQSSALPFGNSQAELVVHFFGDFKCGFCQAAIRDLEEAGRVTGIPIRGYFHPFPQEEECNPGYGILGHHGACLGAKLAFCAKGRPDQDQIFHFLFQNPNSILSNVKESLYFIETTGPKFDGLGRCLGDPRISQLLDQELKLAKDFDVRMTPTFFLGTRKIEGSPSRVEWINLLQEYKNGVQK